MKKILIIDDTVSEQKLMTAILQDNGFSCEVANDGVTGESRAKDLKPDLILLDVVMPNRDGFQTCRSIKKNPELKDIPVVLVTSKGTDTDKAWGLKQGAASYLVKPFDPKALLDTVNKYIR